MSDNIYKATGIYGIRNVLDGKTYVGKTLMNFGDRWDCHRAQLNGGYHNNKHLQNAWNKYGSDSFAFFVIEECSDPERTNELEIKYISEYRKRGICYNISDGGDGGNLLGKHLSDATKRRIGEKNRVNMTGRKPSEETKQKMSKSQRAFWDSVSDEYREQWGKQMSERASGYKWSQKSKDNFSSLQRTRPNGAKHSVDDVRKIRKLHEEEEKTYTEISEITGIALSTVYSIATYRRWKYV